MLNQKLRELWKSHKELCYDCWYVVKSIILLFLIFYTVASSNIIAKALTGLVISIVLVVEFRKSLNPFWQPTFAQKTYTSLYGELMIMFSIPIGLVLHSVMSANVVLSPIEFGFSTILWVSTVGILSVCVSRWSERFGITKTIAAPLWVPHQTAIYSYNPVEYTVYWQLKNLLSNYNLVSAKQTKLGDTDLYLTVKAAEDYGIKRFEGRDELLTWIEADKTIDAAYCDRCQTESAEVAVNNIRYPLLEVPPEGYTNTVFFCHECENEIIHELLEQDSEILTESFVLAYTI